MKADWTVDEENCGGGVNIIDAEGNRVAHTSRVCRAGKEIISEAQARANGKLIAAAPDLRRAAHIAVSWLEATIADGVHADRARADLKIIQAALNKVTR